MEQKEKSDVNLLFKLKNKNGSWVFLLKKKKMAAGPQDCYPSWSVSSALSDCLWTKLRCRHKVVWPGAWVQSNQSELEPGNRSKPVDGAESPLVSDFSLAFSHFSRVCDSLLSFSYFFFNCLLYSIGYTAFWIIITFMVWVFYTIFILIWNIFFDVGETALPKHSNEFYNLGFPRYPYFLFWKRWILKYGKSGSGVPGGSAD